MGTIVSTRRKIALALAIAISIGLVGCSTFELESCGGISDFRDADKPRIRGAKVRMNLLHPEWAGARLFTYAAMSALAYRDDPRLSDIDNKAGAAANRTSVELDRLRDRLVGEQWVIDEAFLTAARADDNTDGFFYHVWTRQSGDEQEIVIAFRGTDGPGDFRYGNLRQLTRWFSSRDQYAHGQKIARAVTRKYPPVVNDAGRMVQFVNVTGHSLGGGLAQNALYAQPDGIRQAFAFDPSPVTAYFDQDLVVRQHGCSCLGAEFAGLGAPGDTRNDESRIYRIYESQEILAWLRYPLKILLPLRRHITEVRFGFHQGGLVDAHGMRRLALNLCDPKPPAGSAQCQAAPDPVPANEAWFAGVDGKQSTGVCTARFTAAQAALCRQRFDGFVCPH